MQFVFMYIMYCICICIIMYMYMYMYMCAVMRGVADFSGDELDPALLEEEEARAMQLRLAEQLDEADFNLDQFIVRTAAAAAG